MASPSGQISPSGYGSSMGEKRVVSNPSKKLSHRQILTGASRLADRYCPIGT